MINRLINSLFLTSKINKNLKSGIRRNKKNKGKKNVGDVKNNQKKNMFRFFLLILQSLVCY